jgi:hypothetical protein
MEELLLNNNRDKWRTSFKCRTNLKCITLFSFQQQGVIQVAGSQKLTKSFREAKICYFIFIHNFLDWCCHLYNIRSSMIEWQTIVLAYLGSQCTKFQAAPWNADFLRPFIWNHASGPMQFHDGSNKQTASVHQILCKSQKKCND